MIRRPVRIFILGLTLVLSIGSLIAFAQSASVELQSQAAQAFRNRDYGEAVRLFRQITTVDPQNALAWHFLGQSLQRTGDVAGARNAYAKVLLISSEGVVAVRTLKFICTLDVPPGAKKNKDGYIYIGDLHNGHVVYIAPNCDRFDGDYRNSKPNGRGVLTLANGSRFDGEFRDGKPNGHIVFTGADGFRYDGEYRDSKPNGHGVLTLANGSRYDGEFHDGRFINGHGVAIEVDGSRTDGEYREGKLNGHGVWILANGSRFDGEFRDGKPNGHGIETLANGSQHVGEFRDGNYIGR